MPEDRVDRRLAAIFAGDVAGYSRLMGADEEGTLRQLKAHHKVLVDPKIAEYRGRIVKTTGDGILVEFASVVDAVRCAVDIQRGMIERNSNLPAESRIQFRIGINVGDIIIDGDDIIGDGVNVAARLEGLADPGGVMVSGIVHDQVRDKLSFGFEDMGEQAVKNIARPVRAYRIPLDDGAKPALALPDKPSIAVLAFQNMSGDPEQEYFADGMVEDIITALSRFPHLFVIARNSSFTYKGKPVDVKQVGRELGVRYVLEGSVRKAANRVRITGQLIDATTGVHLWADHFDGGIEDIFDLQDQVTARVVGAIAPKLEQAEIERAKRKPTDSLDAYDYYLRGIATLHRGAFQAHDQAVGLFCRATELDPDFASAYGMAALCYVPRKTNGWMTDPERETAEAAQLARRAAELGKNDAVALSAAGYSLAYLVHDLETAAALIDRALVLNPNLAAAWLRSSWVRLYLGQPELVIEHAAKAMRLSPLDPFLSGMQGATAFAHFFAGRYDEAAAWAARALREQPHYLTALRVAAASNALAGRMEEAQKAIAKLRQLDPGLRISNIGDRLPLRQSADLTRYAEGLRTAGLPD